jgi:hypothetical protein
LPVRTSASVSTPEIAHEQDDPIRRLSPIYFDQCRSKPVLGNQPFDLWDAAPGKIAVGG